MMQLIVKICMVILTTSITGSVLFGIWYLIGLVIERIGYFHVQYQILKVSMLFWLFPIAFIELMVFNGAMWDYVLSARTKAISAFALVFLCVWTIGFCTLVWKYCRDDYTTVRKLSAACVVDGEIYDLFLEICHKLDISTDEVELVFDYSVGSPCIGGFRKNYIVLPNLEYTQEQLEVIFLHELTHYRQKSHIYRHLAQLILAIHFFNPFAWMLKSKLRYWAEYTCDYDAIPRTEGVRAYFDIIELIAKAPSIESYFGSNLYENERELSKRFRLVEMGYEKEKKIKKWGMFVAITMFLLSTGIAQAATFAFGQAYYDTVFATAEYVELEAEPQPELEEFYLEKLDSNVIWEEWKESDIVPTEQTSDIIYEANIEPNTVKVSSAISVMSDKYVTILIFGDETYEPFRYGLIKSDGSVVYVEDTHMSSYEFKASSSDSYRPFVWNIGSKPFDLTFIVCP